MISIAVVSKICIDDVNWSICEVPSGSRVEGTRDHRSATSGEVWCTLICKGHVSKTWSCVLTCCDSSDWCCSGLHHTTNKLWRSSWEVIYLCFSIDSIFSIIL